MGKLIDVKVIIVDVKLGAELSAVIKEAIALAVIEWMDVIFLHNNQEYIIYVDDIFKCCAPT